MSNNPGSTLSLQLTIHRPLIKKPTLRIGHHLLEGQIVSLTKPFAVLLRSSPLNAREPLQAHGEDADDQSQLGTQDVSYDVAAIVKKKIVFSKRPVPIVPTNLLKS